MDQTCRFTAIIVQEGEVYVAHCPELDITSEGRSVTNARANLTDAVSLYLETADPEDVSLRMRAAREAKESTEESLG